MRLLILCDSHLQLKESEAFASQLHSLCTCQRRDILYMPWDCGLDRLMAHDLLHQAQEVMIWICLYVAVWDTHELQVDWKLIPKILFMINLGTGATAGGGTWSCAHSIQKCKPCFQQASSTSSLLDRAAQRDLVSGQQDLKKSENQTTMLAFRCQAEPSGIQIAKQDSMHISLRDCQLRCPMSFNPSLCA